MTTAYNMCWLNPRPPATREVHVAYGVTNTVVVGGDVEAVILFPSLMTPLVRHVSHSGPWLELLLASKATITPAHVNRQLKICAGLDADKLYHPNWLFPAPGDKILVEDAPPVEGIVRTHELFEGVLHELFEKRMKRAGLTKLYRVRVAAEALPMGPPYVMPVRPEKDKDNLAWRAERQDYLVRDMLMERHKLAGHPRLPDDGCFAFEVDQDLKLGSNPDHAEPIQTYHPVYVLEAKEPAHLNFGHLTDIHMNARLDLLKKSPARVMDHTPTVGDLLQPTNTAFANLLGQMAGAASVHALAIGGDLIDHHLNAYLRDGDAKAPSTMQGVWDTVDLNRAQNYVPCVDIVGFYSLLRSFMRRCDKPIFGIAGNHDAYLDAFGISPRIMKTRANAGIPADLNLTLYEAVLAFGPSYADFKYHVDPPSSFDSAWMEWFYTVFTPFADASVQLPKQRVVCLGWGNDEDMFLGGQGNSHLPRADQSVSDLQLTLLNHACSQSKHPVFVISHFTVASFEEKLTMVVGEELQDTQQSMAPSMTAARGTLHGRDDAEDFFNMGTFEKNHREFAALLKKEKIACVLTGHSHRRGLYLLDRSNRSGNRDIIFYDPERADVADVPLSQRTPAIIVSDSAGPYPRYNYAGELGGWGSDLPAGSVVHLDQSGRPHRVQVVRAQGAAPPRLSVAVDYLDIEREEFWDEPLQTATFSASAEAAWIRGGCIGPFYELNLGHRKGKVHGVSVGSIQFYARRAEQGSPASHHPYFEVVPPADGKAKLDASQSAAFRRWCCDSSPGDAFLSIAINVLEHVDIKTAARWKMDAWQFEVSVRKLTVTQANRGTDVRMRYCFARPLRFAGRFTYRDLPDFDQRAHRAKSVARS